MPDQMFDPQKIGTGEGESPLAQPAQKFDMRTMATDTASAQKGEEPKPYMPPPSPFAPPAGGMQIPPPPPSMATATEKEVSFELPQMSETALRGNAQPPAKDMTAAPITSPEQKGGMKKKGIFISLLSAIVVLGVAAAGYFFVYPAFFGGVEVAQTPPPSEQPAVPQLETPAPQPEEPVPQPETPTVTEETPAQTDLPAQAGTPAEVSRPAPEEKYVSLFKTASDGIIDIALAETALSGIKSAILFATAQTPSLKEYAVKGSDGKFISIGKILSLLFPSTFTDELGANFESGILFSYADDKGTWLGVAAQLKSDANANEAQSKVSGLENSAELSNIFLSDAGAQTTWKNGQAEGVATRYLTYGLSGAGINYGWLENKLIISASYSGFKEAVKRQK